MADRLSANRATIYLLRERGIEPISRLNEALRVADFRRGPRLGPGGHVVRWPKPTSIRSLGRQTYRALAGSITVREARARVARPGFRTRAVVVVMALLEPKPATQEDLGALYRARWYADPGPRSLKAAMQMRELPARTPVVARKEVWAHSLAYNLIRTVMAQAAAELKHANGCGAGRGQVRFPRRQSRGRIDAPPHSGRHLTGSYRAVDRGVPRQ